MGEAPDPPRGCGRDARPLVQRQRAGSALTASPALSCHVCYGWICLVNRALLRGPAVLCLPILVENRPQRLIEILAVLQERFAEQAFLHRADLSQRAVAAAVAHGSARLEAVNPDRLEREAHQQFSSFLEPTGSTVLYPDCGAVCGTPA